MKKNKIFKVISAFLSLFSIGPKMPALKSKIYDYSISDRCTDDFYVSDKNYIYSPLSTKLALLMAENGATGQSLKEILDCYKFKNIDESNSFVNSVSRSSNFSDFDDISTDSLKYISFPKNSDTYIKLHSILSATEENPYTLNIVLKKYGFKNYDEAKNWSSSVIKEDYLNHNFFNISNSIWVNDTKFPGIKFSNKFEHDIKIIFNASSGIVNDLNAKSIIDNWVKKSTNGKVTDFLKDSRFESILINTVYFKSDFVDKFKKENTRQKEFKNIDDTISKTDFMNDIRGKDTYENDYFENERFQSLRLNYVSGFKLYLFLPKEGKNLNDITPYDLNTIQDLMSQRSDKKQEKHEKKHDIYEDNFDMNYETDMIQKKIIFDISIPKFKDESNINLVDFCKNNLNIHGIFDGGMDSICVSKDGSKFPMKVSGIYQKATIELNEEGTEAAAATAITVNCLSCAPTVNREKCVEFHADRPFKYVIKDQNDNVVFEGQRTDFKDKGNLH